MFVKMAYKKRLADARKIMELIGKIDKEKETVDIEKILIDFLSFLNKNGYINDYDFVYETQIKKFINQIKTNL